MSNDLNAFYCHNMSEPGGTERNKIEFCYGNVVAVHAQLRQKIKKKTLTLSIHFIRFFLPEYVQGFSQGQIKLLINLTCLFLAYGRKVYTLKETCMQKIAEPVISEAALTTSPQCRLRKIYPFLLYSYTFTKNII